MSVAALTLGSAANAIRPSAAKAASAPTSATIRASGRVRSYHANPPARASDKIAKAPSCQVTRSAGRPCQDLDRGGVADDPAVREHHHPVGRGEAALEPVLGKEHRGVEVIVDATKQPEKLIAGDGSSCEVGSSRTTRSGAPAIAAPSAVRCSSPPDSSL